MTATIISPVGRLDSANAQAFEREVLAHLETRPTHLVMNCDKLTYISSAGLRVVLVAAKRMRTGGGRFSLCGLSAPVAEVFEISGFNAILNIYANLDAAVAAAG